MNVYLYFLFILINFVILNRALPKYEYGLRNDKQPYLTKRKASKINKDYGNRDEDLIDNNNARILKEKMSGNNYEKQKRSNRMGGYGRRYVRLFKRDLRPQRYEDAYGIVYGNGRPVGIIEPYPYPQVYEYSPIVGQVRSQSYADDYGPKLKFPEKSNFEEDLNEDKLDDSVKYSNDKYPLTYNDFKLNNNDYGKRSGMCNSIENDLSLAEEKQPAYSRKANEDSNLEQDDQKLQEKKSSAITDEQVEELKSTLSKIKNPGPSDSVEEIERSLRSILSDMGLVSEEEGEYLTKDKRDANLDLNAKEDENLEEGSNKIDLIKVDNGQIQNERNKREEIKQIDSSNPMPKANAFLSKPSIIKDASSKMAHSEENESPFVRNKRQEVKTDDIMKGLEKSGDLTVSGNKSPLASSEVEGGETTSHPVKLNKREQSELDYQKHVEDMIQFKIDAIKEQVKREIEAMNPADVSTAKNYDGRRRKRDLSTTLLEEESSDLDPQKHPGEVLKPYVRRRRNADVATSLKEIKRSLLDFSNLNKIDSGDYLELSGDKHEQQRYESDYQVDPQESKLLPKDSRANLENSKTAGGSIDVENEHVAKIGKRRLLSVFNSDTDDNLSPADNPETEVVEKENSLTREKRGDQLKLEGKDEGQSVALNKANENLQEKEENKDSVKIEKKSAEQNLQEEDGFKGNDFASLEKQNGNSQIESAKDSIDVSKLEKKSMQENSDQYASLDKPTSGLEDKESSSIEKKMSEKNAELELKAVQTANSAKHQDDKKTIEDAATKVEVAPLKYDLKIEAARKRRRAEEDVIDERKLNFGRRKRENDFMTEEDLSNIPYRSDDMEFDDEGDEFDDDSLDDRTMEKREANGDLVSYGESKRSLNYENEYEDPEEYKISRKRSASGDDASNRNSEFVERQGKRFFDYPEMYVRRKRQNYDISNLRNGGAALHHIAAIKERNMQRATNTRNKRMQEKNTKKADELEGVDVFGALPQSFNGELSRFKRVKRRAEQDISEG